MNPPPESSDESGIVTKVTRIVCSFNAHSWAVRGPSCFLGQRVAARAAQRRAARDRNQDWPGAPCDVECFLCRECDRRWRRLSFHAQFTMRLQYWAALVVLVTLLGTSVAATAAQDITVADGIAAAEALYGAAAYEDAIAALNQLAASPVASDRERATIERYRALCLLALNRLNEAASAAEAMVRHHPLYAPGQDELSPRTRQMFQQAQRHVLPGMAQEQYAEAKAAYEAGRRQEASSQFNRVLEMLDVIAAAGEAPPLMADLRVLAIGFRRLAAVAAQASAPPQSRPAAPGQAQTARADRPASGESA